jgi:hypothetical protein
MYRQHSVELLFMYLNNMAVYTGWLFVLELTGSAFIYDNQVFSCHLHSSNSIFTAKVYAVYRALLFIQCHSQ